MTSKLVIALTIIISACHPVAAKESWGLVNYLKAVTPNLIDFIEDNTLYEYEGWEYPEIVIQNQKAICNVVYVPPRDECDVAGYYNENNNTIYIRDEPTQHMVEDRFFEVVLVHELVHFLQWHDGTYDIVPCRKKLEEHAFEVQDKFVKTQGIDPQQAPDPLFSLLVSQCQDQGSPYFAPGGG